MADPAVPLWLAGRAGHVDIETAAPLIAGSHAELIVTYTAGFFGIDDTGGLRVVTRFASDLGQPQFDDPAAANYVSAEASNGAVLALRYDYKGHIRPWDRTIQVRVVRGFLREGERIAVRIGDRRFGSPGLRLQTYAEEDFRLRVFVDPVATGLYAEAPCRHTLSVVAGAPAAWRAVLPTMVRTGEDFRLGIRAEDAWGNPAAAAAATLRLDWSIGGLPDTLLWPDGQSSLTLDGLSLPGTGDVRLLLRDNLGAVLAEANPLRVTERAALLPFWGDLHGQSGETIGTGTAESYFRFARDTAFLDVVGHQGNDFQITLPFWDELNRLTRAFHQPDRFITVPGYEWSGNTGLGGDRNVYFAEERDELYRSSHALVSDEADLATDCNTADRLFAQLQDLDAVVNAHVGGRYADIALAHDNRVERSVEIHSAWGTFEWLLHDAFEAGLRVGVVCNSDDHKGRPGASSPGASQFGAYGGLTCLLLPKLSRPAVFAALRQRHHYGTTGARLHLDLRARFARPVRLFEEDPAMGGTLSRLETVAMMGDIVQTDAAELMLEIDILAASAIERVEIRRGPEVVEVIRPYAADPGSHRLRVVMEGAEYRGRGRQTVWDGQALLEGNTIVSATPFNFWNHDKPLRSTAEGLAWSLVTTGNFAGFDVLLADAAAGRLRISTPHAALDLDVEAIGPEPLVFEAGGLARRLSLLRLPERLETRALRLTRTVARAAAGDTPLWVSVVLEDGHQAWSSPIYLIN